MPVVSLTGRASLTNHGKQLVALSMYDKGIGFLGAAVLLGKEGGYEYVVLHLLCQGLEIVVKAFLLFRNYGNYRPLLQKKLGHDLEKLVRVAVNEFGFNAPSAEFATELRHLNSVYKRHFLRYGSGYDILVDPRSIPSRRVFRKLLAAIRLAQRSLPAEAIHSAEHLGMRARAT